MKNSWKSLAPDLVTLSLLLTLLSCSSSSPVGGGGRSPSGLGATTTTLTTGSTTTLSQGTTTTLSGGTTTTLTGGTTTTLSSPPTTQPPGTWRSSLYPANWAPAQPDGQGRFLHDFSYAGYHNGQGEPPEGVLGMYVNVTQSPYSADASGQADATNAIQRAIDDVSNAGGGTVYLPAGTFRVKPQGTNRYALWIKHSKVLFKGAGTGITFIFNDEVQMREKETIRVSPDPVNNFTWHWTNQKTRVTQDVTLPTSTISVESVAGLRVGDWVVLYADASDAWIADHQMTGKWTTQGMGGVALLRQIKGIQGLQITIDTPTRYWMKQRDGFRLNTVPQPLEEIGLQDFSIGQKQVPLNELDDQQYSTPGTRSYSIHQAHAIIFNHVVNGWIRRVSTYRPPVNTDDIHILSNTLKLYNSKNVTVDSCDFRKVAYKGEGGNGYHFIHQGSDNLIKNSYAELGRHNYDFAGLEVSGNVILRSRSVDARLPSDFHMYLSPANLIDNMTLDLDYIGAFYRDTATPKHGHGTTQSVFWNTKGLRPKNQFTKNYVINTQQFGWGYAIGTSGKTSKVESPGGENSEPIDFVEGVSTGDKLFPPSLYEDQKVRRLGP